MSEEKEKTENIVMTVFWTLLKIGLGIMAAYFLLMFGLFFIAAL